MAKNTNTVSPAASAVVGNNAGKPAPAAAATPAAVTIATTPAVKGKPGPKGDGSITVREQKANDRKAAVASLIKSLPAGTQIFTVVRDEAVNGSASSVSLLTFNPDDKAAGKFNPTATDMESIALVLDHKVSRAADIKGRAIRVPGVENVGAKLVRALGDALYGDSAAFPHAEI